MKKSKIIAIATAIPVLSFIYVNNDKNVQDCLLDDPNIINEVTKVTSVDTLYEECINHIKKYESFSDTIYIDNDGSRTIGYGHHISKLEKFKNTISEKRADRLLRKDFNKKLKWVKKKYNLEDNKSYALALFAFNIGETKLNNSTLNKLVLEGKSIDTEIVKWKWFKYRGKYKENKRLKERRKFELKIFNSKKV